MENENEMKKKSLMIQVEENGKKYQKDLIEFIQENKKQLNSLIQDKSIMVLGLTGTGKSTLINYLNNIPLVCAKKNGKWILKLENENLSLSGGFSIASIGHKVYSQTFLPAAYTPKGENFSYIDNPGFKDTHGLSMEIASGFFRTEITTNVNHLKFLLLLSYPDLNERGDQFRTSIKAFSHFIGAFDSDDHTKNLSKSIGIIITKVDNDGESDKKMKDDLKTKLKEVLQDEIDNQKLSQNEEIVFNEIIDNFQIEIFSNPKKEGPVSIDQAEAIKNLIRTKLQYAKKNDLKLRAKISDTYKLELLQYITYSYKNFEEDFSDLFNMAISRIYKRNTISTDLVKRKNLYNLFDEIIRNGSEAKFFDDYLNNLSSQILNDEEKDELMSKRKTFDYFIKLFSEREKQVFYTAKKWINDKNKSKLEYLISDLLKHLFEKFKDFEQSIEVEIQSGIEIFVKNKITQAVDINDIKQLEKRLSVIQESIFKDGDFETFLKNINDYILEKNEKELLLSKEKELRDFIDVLPNEKKSIFSVNHRKWVGYDFRNELEKLNQELKNFYQETSTLNNGVYSYRGYFANIKSILDTINYRVDIRNINSVEIYAFIAVNFNQDFLLQKEKYYGQSPDLIIISPRVLISSKKTVDLSYVHSPDYPDGIRKANKFSSCSSNGGDGKPGLPGINGGNLLIITNEKTHVSNNLVFVSKGGIGGPGQDGEDGSAGCKGDPGVRSRINDKSDIISKFDIENNAYTYESHIYYGDYGTEGRRGGDSGRGGIGGYNGLSGEFVLIDGKGDSSRIFSKIGSYGKGIDGKSGTPGTGGQYGDTVLRKYIKLSCNWFSAIMSIGQMCWVGLSSGFTDVYLTEESQKYALSGSSTSEKNTNEIIKPQKRKEIKIIDKQNEYFKLFYEISTSFNRFLLTNSHFINETDSDLYFLIERIEILTKNGLNDISYFILIDLKKKVTKYQQSTNKEHLLLSYIQTTISSLIMWFNSVHEKTLVVNLENYLDITFSQVKSWSSLAKQNLINTYRENYESNLKNKIQEAINLVNILQKDIQTNENELNKDIAKILEEIVKLKKEVQEEDLRLVKKKEELKKALILKTIFSSLQIVTSVMSLMGPKGALIGSFVQAGVNLGSQAFNSNGKHESSSLSPAIKTAINNYQETLNVRNTYQLNKIENEAKVLEAQINLKNKNSLEQKVDLTLESRLKNLPDSLKKFQLQKQYAENKQASSSNEVDKKKYENLAKEAKKNSDKFEKQATTSAINLGVKVAEISLDLASEIKMGSDKIEIIENEITVNLGRLNQLDLIKQSMDQMQNTLFKEMNNEIDFFNKNLYNSSNALLDFKRWQIKERLTELKDQIFSLTNPFVGHKKVGNTISRIENAILTMIDIHSRIETFEQQNEFANYITDIIRDKDLAFKNLPFEIQNKINSLEKKINENIIEERYQQAVNAFKFWSFPFNCEYIQNNLRNEETNAGNIDFKINIYAKQLEQMLNHVKNDKSEIRPSIDNHVINRLFDRYIPFFQWSTRNYPYELKRLLSGKLTTLYADINYARFDAIKFCTLDLLIETDAPDTNRTLNGLLKNFIVEMTHSGESNYKYKGKTITINMNYQSGEKLSLKHQYGSTENSNNSFKKLAANRPVLSPYTFWTIQIKAIEKEKEEELFEKIDSIMHENVELKVFLYGQGQYVDDSKENVCDKF